jgi:hypothetical protein
MRQILENFFLKLPHYTSFMKRLPKDSDYIFREKTDRPMKKNLKFIARKKEHESAEHGGGEAAVKKTPLHRKF